MLVLPLKASVRFDIHSALAIWLDSDQEVSFEHKPKNPLEFVLPKPDFSSAACRSDLLRLQGLRNCLCEAILKSDSHKVALEESAMDDLHEYHAALLEFERRGFPTIDDEHSNGLQLTWKSAYGPQKETHASLVWDRAVTLFNLAALHTSKAADCPVTDRDACKQAVSHCQNAASLLSILRELVQSQDYATVDMSQAMLIFWERMMIAEAQLGIYRMVALAQDTSTKHSSLSALAKAAHQLFNEALTAAQDPRLASELPVHSKDWGAYCKAQSMMCSAKAEYHMAVVHRLGSEWGNEIARLRECKSQLEECRDFCKTLDADGVVGYTRRECTAYYPVVSDRLNEAESDNYKVYQDDVPKRVNELPAKQLAKTNPNLPPTMLTPKKPLFVGL